MNAANWMDRLSDWIGSLVPGCGRLPARHPLKVSLVMGWLGLISGWATMAVGGIFSLIVGRGNPFDEHPVFLAGGIVMGLILVAPWACWIGMRRRWALPLVVYCSVAHYLSFLVIDRLDRSGEGWTLACFGLLTGLAVALAGMVITQRFLLPWLVVTALISSGSISSFWLIKDLHLLTTFLPREAEMIFVVAWFFSLLHTPLALCLGWLVWDWQQTMPKFEPVNSPESPA